MSEPSRTLPAHPSLEQLRKQAKDLLRFFESGDSAAAQRCRDQSHRGPPEAQVLLRRFDTDHRRQSGNSRGDGIVRARGALGLPAHQRCRHHASCSAASAARAERRWLA
jgi:hypothetical protein